MDKGLQEKLETEAHAVFKHSGMRAALWVFSTAYMVIGALADKETDRFKREDLRLTQLDCIGLSQEFHSEHFKTETETN